MKLIKLTAVERITHDYKVGDCEHGLKWEIDTDYNSDSLDNMWSVQTFGFAGVGSLGVGMYYIIDLENSNIKSITKEDDFGGLMELYEVTLKKHIEKIRIDNIDIIIDKSS